MQPNFIRTQILPPPGKVTVAGRDFSVSEGNVTVTESITSANTFPSSEKDAIYLFLGQSANELEINCSKRAILNEVALYIEYAGFSGNKTTANESKEGAAIKNGSVGKATIANSTFTENTASAGGAVFNGGTVTITGSTFKGNKATQYGGAINNQNKLTVETSVFINNTSTKYGGAVYFNSPGTISGSIFAGNKASSDRGGAVFLSEHGGTTSVPVTITGSTFGTASDTIYTAEVFTFAGTNCINANVIKSNREIAKINVAEGAAFVFHDYSCWNQYSDTDQKSWTKSSIKVDGALASAASLTFAGSQGVEFTGNNNAVTGTITVTGDLASWFTESAEDKITLAAGADFSGVKSITVTDTKGTADTSDDESSPSGSVTVTDPQGTQVMYVVAIEENSLTISRTESRVDITDELNAKTAGTEPAEGVSDVTKETAAAGTVAVIGNEETQFDANGTVLYMNGLNAEFKNLKNGKRLYGGGLNALETANVTLNGDLLISGTDIALDFIYGGGYLYGSDAVPSGSFRSTVRIAEDATFAATTGYGTISLLGGSHINRTDATTITAHSFLTIDADVRNADFVCGGHGCYTTTEIMGDSSLSISNGTYGNENDEIVMVAGGSVLYVNSNNATLTQNGNTHLTITGGSFNSNVYGGNIFLYADKSALDKGTTATLNGKSQVTIDCSAGEKITFNKNIFAGSNGDNAVTSTKVTFIGKGSGEEITSEKLSIAGYVSGDSSGRHWETGIENYENFVTGSREVYFKNFYGAPGAEALYDFDEFTFENSRVNLGDAALNRACETWTFSTGSGVEWNAALNFSGDTVILGESGDGITSDWTVFAGLDSVANFNDMTVKIFGTDAKWTDNSYWKAGSYKLAMEENIADDEVASYDLVVSKLA